MTSPGSYATVAKRCHDGLIRQGSHPWTNASTRRGSVLRVPHEHAPYRDSH